MKRQVNQLVMEYQNVIAKLDNKLAVYEQLGTPEEIAKKLDLTLTSIVESKVGEIDVKKTNAIIEARKRLSEKDALENKEIEKKTEIKEVIATLNKPNLVGDMKTLLSKFKKD